MKSTSNMTVGAAITTLTIFLLGVIGWVANIYQVVVGITALNSVMNMSGMLLFKLIAIFLGPVGSVLGLIGFFH